MPAISDKPACGGGIENRARIESLEASEKRQWEAIERVANRLPVWVTVVIGLLMGLLGFFVKS